MPPSITPSVFFFSDYKTLLQALVSQQHESKGIKAQLAQSCGMSRTYLPQVLNGKAQLTEDQALRACAFFGLGRLETKYFQVLLRIQKAATPDLRNFLEEERTELIQQSRELSGHLKNTEKQNDKIASTYYAQWYYAAIHIALYNPRFQKPNVLAKYLGLPTSTVLRALQFLVSAGLASQKNGLFKAKESNFHLPKDSPHVIRKHSQWRVKALESLEQEQATDFHYTSIVGIAAADREAFKSLFIQFVSQARELVKKSSPEERLCVYSLDFFDLEKQV